jgi:uncharacterized pyridoxal phosphate-containing UPF0001 family protein
MRKATRFATQAKSNVGGIMRVFIRVAAGRAPDPFEEIRAIFHKLPHRKVASTGTSRSFTLATRDGSVTVRLSFALAKTDRSPSLDATSQAPWRCSGTHG